MNSYNPSFFKEVVGNWKIFGASRQLISWPLIPGQLLPGQLLPGQIKPRTTHTNNNSYHRITRNTSKYVKKNFRTLWIYLKEKHSYFIVYKRKDFLKNICIRCTGTLYSVHCRYRPFFRNFSKLSETIWDELS